MSWDAEDVLFLGAVAFLAGAFDKDEKEETPSSFSRSSSRSASSESPFDAKCPKCKGKAFPSHGLEKICSKCYFESLKK